MYMGWLSRTSNKPPLYCQEEVETNPLAYEGEEFIRSYHHGASMQKTAAQVVHARVSQILACIDWSSTETSSSQLTII